MAQQARDDDNRATMRHPVALQALTLHALQKPRSVLAVNQFRLAILSAPFDYIRDPQAIYARSFALVRQATDLSDVPPAIEPLVVRLVHACGMPDIVTDLAFSVGIEQAAWRALKAGAPLFADCEMVVNGIIRSRLPAANEVICTLNEAGVADDAKALSTTRSAAAVDRWLTHPPGGVVVVGNAPTALFRVLELMAAGRLRPAAVLGFPVGFVGAAESKQALTEHHAGTPYVTLLGQRGGSAIAAAAVNGLASCFA
ncbi:MAG: precorrin-8X methylmutase [Pseudomonadota bacterium]